MGFAIGFAGAYLFVCGAYYFNCYTTASEYVSSGADAFFVNAGENAQEARELLDMITRQSGWQFIVTGVNRVFYLVREIALTVLLWYAMREDGKKLYFLLVPLMHLAAMVPDGLFQAGILENSYGKDAVTCVLSAGIAFLAARQYNAKEDLVAHFQVEKAPCQTEKIESATPRVPGFVRRGAFCFCGGRGYESASGAFVGGGELPDNGCGPTETGVVSGSQGRRAPDRGWRCSRRRPPAPPADTA